MLCRAVVAALAFASSVMGLKPVKAPTVTRRSVFGLGALTVGAPAFGATSSELKGMLGKLDDELSEESLAKARGVKKEESFNIELPKVSAPKVTVTPKAPKAPREPKDPAAPAPSPLASFEAPDFGAAAREEGRRKAEARRAKAEAAKAPSSSSGSGVAPSNAGDATDNSEVYVALRAKREAQRAAAEAAEEERKFKRLTPVEQARYRKEKKLK